MKRVERRAQKSRLKVGEQGTPLVLYQVRYHCEVRENKTLKEAILKIHRDYC